MGEASFPTISGPVALGSVEEIGELAGRLRDQYPVFLAVTNPQFQMHYLASNY